MKNLSDQPCLIARSLAVVGDAWSMLIMRDAHAGLTRFDDFRKGLGIAPTMLTGRLSALTDEGLLEKRRYSERPPRDEYVLTEAGRDFLPVLFAIGAWGRKHRGGGRRHPVLRRRGRNGDRSRYHRPRDRRSGRNTSHSRRRNRMSGAAFRRHGRQCAGAVTPWRPPSIFLAFFLYL